MVTPSPAWPRAPALPLPHRPVQEHCQDRTHRTSKDTVTQHNHTSHHTSPSTVFSFLPSVHPVSPPPHSSTSVPLTSSPSTRRLVSTTFPPPRPDNNIEHTSRHRPFHFAPRRNANIQDLYAIVATCPSSLGSPSVGLYTQSHPLRYTSRLQRPPDSTCPLSSRHRDNCRRKCSFVKKHSRLNHPLTRCPAPFSGDTDVSLFMCLEISRR